MESSEEGIKPKESQGIGWKERDLERPEEREEENVYCSHRIVSTCW